MAQVASIVLGDINHSYAYDWMAQVVLGDINHSYAYDWMAQVASIVLGDINHSYAYDWMTRGVSETFLLVGNVPPHQLSKIYKIDREEGNNYDYKMTRVNRITCIGSGASKLNCYVQNFDPSMTDEAAIMYAFNGIRQAIQTDWPSGGAIRVIVLYPQGRHHLRYCSQIRTFEPTIWDHRCDSPYVEIFPREPNFYPAPAGRGRGRRR